MIKKIAGLGLCIFFASSVVLADNPFGNNTIDNEETVSGKSIKNTNTTINTKTISSVTGYGSSSSSSSTQTSQYTVVKGDHLCLIARNLLGDANRWPEIVELSKDRYPSLITNPDLIEVGWVLTLPGGRSSSSSSSSNNSSNNTNSNSSNNNTSGTPSSLGNTQASEFYELGDKAYNEWQEYTENSARGEWIRKVGEIVKNTNTYGMKKSLIIAQIINESGWMSTHASSLSKFNNVLGINTDMGRIKPSMQDSTWSKKQTSGYNNVTQWSSDGSHIVGTYESMRHYDSIEECIEDYANVLSLYHPECKGSNNIEDYRSFLEGYTPNPNASTTDKYKNIIKKYNLERFDE